VTPVTDPGGSAGERVQQGASDGIDVSVVVPCYADAATLPALIERLAPVLVGLGRPVELILVDDGCPDATATVAVEQARELPFSTVVVRLARNFGQHAAVFAGLAEARGRIVVTMDSDLQHPPEEIPRFVEAVSPEFPVVSGYRANRRDPAPRRVVTWLLSAWLRRQTGRALRDFGSMFRAYDRSVVDQLLLFREQRRFIPALVAWLGVPVREVPFVHQPRGAAGSRYRLGPLVDMGIDLVTGYSIFPLRLVVLLGVAGSALGFVATAGFGVYRVVVGAGISGLVSAFALMFLLSGVQLLLLALLGEYIGRVYGETRRRPYYIVGEVARHG
jgi:undecaprenyl-phosphate 4-deoxy-4-formamido-L-arabinose transferase